MPFEAQMRAATTLRRAVGLKKDEYFVDGKHVS